MDEEDLDKYAKELVDDVIQQAMSREGFATMAKDQSLEDQAKCMVDEVIQNALIRLKTSMSDGEQTYEAIRFGDKSREPTTNVVREEDYKLRDINWLTIEEFSIEQAERKIEEFIATWEYENSWLYCIDFLGEDDLEFNKRFRFRVRWSIPTRRKPIPRATACVYFTFSVSKIKPKHYPVEVYYVFESNRLVHRPGKSRFREKWLKDIIESKVKVIAAINF